MLLALTILTQKGHGMTLTMSLDAPIPSFIDKELRAYNPMLEFQQGISQIANIHFALTDFSFPGIFTGRISRNSWKMKFRLCKKS